MVFELHHFYLMALAFVAGLARGFSGFGAALIFVPLASRLIGPQQASPLLLITDVIVALPLIWSAWAQARKREVMLMAVGAALGSPLGTYVLATGEPVSLRWLITIMTAGMLMLLVSGWRYHGEVKTEATVGVGFISGLFSGIAQIGGPPVVAYWLGGNTKAAVMRASTILFFAVGSFITLANYGVGGLLTTDIFRLSLLIIPCFGLGLWLGSKMFGLASENTFRRICLGLITLALVTSLPVWG